MKNYILLLLVCFVYPLFAQKAADKNFVIVIHGGAGTILKKNMTPEQEKAYNDKMTEALKAGYDTLAKGGTSLSAVEAAIRIMEDSPLFNAGKGSVFTNDGKNEMDASIMDGKNLMAGSVAGVRTIKNPITAAKTVMEKSPHVMMTGKGADQFAKEKGLEIMDTSYFYDEKRWKQLQKAKEEEKQKLDHSDTTGYIESFRTDYKFGTVGAVALDIYGNIAAGTSTGGMTNKRFGRVGDSPIIGAGTYASNNSCAVSCTGHGEYFIRAAVAHDISALVEYKGMTVEQAAKEVVMKKLVKMGAEGGVIVLDAKGNFSMVFNSEGMYRGYMKKNEKPVVLIYK
jgi:beta-aspartyl-peptidase (threonine type)